MMRLAAIGTFCLAGLAAGGSGVAQGLLLECGPDFMDVSQWTVSDGGREYALTVENYDAETKRFDLRISPAEGLPQERARFQAALQSDIICMYLDSSPVAVGAVRQDSGAWLIATGCSGHKVRKDPKC
ncbi:hypothetical protein G5B31_18520 [Rhodobacter sp. SGA-6-6]|uniref:hypothetical protein n=1 Tax=Rhodobacter sp. SGA-6-6 TaxID=2710882 RepID=UPI0013EB04F2|nr:hypothetical protein [Rhodobacter sp. SGA-6-6]NGM47535.1 hypothetical protein [Rhodobacter sp. SGA-6-6]